MSTFLTFDSLKEIVTSLYPEAEFKSSEKDIHHEVVSFILPESNYKVYLYLHYERNYVRVIIDTDITTENNSSINAESLLKHQRTTLIGKWGVKNSTGVLYIEWGIFSDGNVKVTATQLYCLIDELFRNIINYKFCTEKQSKKISELSDC